MNDETTETGYLERIAVIENRLKEEQKSLARKLGQYGGLIALILSILIGIYTVYDKMILEQDRENAKNQAEMHRIVARITEINWKLIELGFQNAPEKLEPLVKNANGEKIALLEQASSLSQSLGEQVGLAASILLSSENLNFGKNDRALFHANTAMALADTAGFRAMSLRYRGRALFASGSTQDIEQARKDFQGSIQLAKESSSTQEHYIVVNTYADWIILEAMFGDCNAGKRTRSEAEQEIGELFPHNPMVLTSFKENVKKILSTQHRCTL